MHEFYRRTDGRTFRSWLRSPCNAARWKRTHRRNTDVRGQPDCLIPPTPTKRRMNKNARSVDKNFFSWRNIWLDQHMRAKITPTGWRIRGFPRSMQLRAAHLGLHCFQSNISPDSRYALLHCTYNPFVENIALHSFTYFTLGLTLLSFLYNSYLGLPIRPSILLLCFSSLPSTTSRFPAGAVAPVKSMSEFGS